MNRINGTVALGAALTALLLPASTTASPKERDSERRAAQPAYLPAKHEKLDSALARLASAREGRGRLVRVEAAARGARRAELEAAIRAAGGTTTGRYAGLIEASVPAGALELLAGHPAARRLRSPARPVPQMLSGEGIASTGATGWHTAETTGKGVEIAIVDVGFAGWEALQAAGELPDQIETADFCDPGVFLADGHGTAVAEIVHEVAPAAKLHLICVDTLVSLGQAKDYIVDNDIPIANHSAGWPNTSRGDGSGGPATPDAIVADARSQGVLWVNSAGNYGLEHWSGNFFDPDLDDDGDDFHDFPGDDEGMDVYLLEGGCVYLKWDDWPTSDQDFDLYLFRSSDDVLVSLDGLGLQNGIQEPTELACADTEDSYYIAIRRDGATQAPRFDLFVTDGLLLEHNVSAGSVIEPAGSPSALAVGAVCWEDGVLQNYSSRGPTIGGAVKPDIAAPDAVSSVTYGAASDCAAGFGGTSASAPHVAAAAALIKQANPGFGPSDLQTALESRTGPPDFPAKNSELGAGSLALGAAPPVPPDAPANSALPPISGLPHQAQTLSAGNGEWLGDPTVFAIRWLRCDGNGNGCVLIAGARSATYPVVLADVGHVLRVRVTASNTGGSTQALSAGTPQIQTPIQPPANVIAPSLAGVAQLGQTLSASSGGWSGTAPLTITIEWLRCDSAGTGCAVIPGASAASHLLGLEDIGATVRIRVTASNPGGAASLTTAPSAVVTPLPLSIVSPPPPPLPTESPIPDVSPPPAPPGPTSIQTRLVMLGFTRSPQIPRAGRKFTLVLRVGTRTVSALGATRRVKCSAKLGRKTLRPAKSLRRGVARCVWAIPKTAAGKRLRGSIVVSEGKRSVRRTVTATVRRAKLRS